MEIYKNHNKVYPTNTNKPIVKEVFNRAKKMGLTAQTVGSIALSGLRSTVGISDVFEEEKKTVNEGLIVFIHGLNDTVKTGNEVYRKEIERLAEGRYEILVPKVYKKGNCSLEKAAVPILREVENYIKENPGKPVQLIGHSNGGRIAAYIETKLRNKDVDIRVTGIAGIFLGSDLVTLSHTAGVVDFLNSTGLTRLFFDPTLLKELKSNSITSLVLINDMRKKITNGSREYTFYATSNDLAIPNYTSCLPVINQGEEHILLSGYDHIGIQKAVCKEEIEKVLRFMKNHKLAGNTYSPDFFPSNLAIISA